MKNIKKFETIINEMDIEELREMASGLRFFTILCIDNKFKHQRNAVIDFALLAKYTYIERVLKETKKEEIPY